MLTNNQVLATGLFNINSKEHKSGGSFYKNNGKSSQTQRNEVDFLLNAVKKLQEELEALKK